ncbi:hypothetical protein ACFFWD_33700 [Bradyrhizobium erythrophlei]|uniref:hypothetical protein n=1 Tax=Bradyrhizobium erythrophlei TaxID=1437360 RepID=UPI0035E95F31
MHGNQVSRKAASTSFTSPKCTVAIPIGSALQRDALLQAGLDAAVRAIHYRKAPNPYGTPAMVKSAVLERIDGDFLLAVCVMRPARTDDQHVRLADQLESNGLRLLERDAADIRCEPLCSNARAVWYNERFPVSVHNRLKIAAVLAEDGPQSIHDLEERARPTCDVIAAVCALACEALVDLDLSEVPLGARTIVRAR